MREVNGLARDGDSRVGSLHRRSTRQRTPRNEVHVKVGHLRQVVPSTLTFGFELIAQGTSVEGAELTLEQIPAVGSCQSCGAKSKLPGFPLQCKSRGGFDLEILEGEELYVESLEMEE